MKNKKKTLKRNSKKKEKTSQKTVEVNKPEPKEPFKQRNKSNISNNKKQTDKLIDIYKQDSGDKIDMTKLEQQPKKIKGKIILIFLIVAICASLAAAAGYLFFTSDKVIDQQEGNAELSILSVQEIASGEQIELEIIYENKEDVAIKEGNISMHYPNGFYFQNAEPKPNNSDNSWDIFNIAAGAGGKIKITGQIVGELNEEKEFTSFLTYKPINFNSNFQDTASKKVKINDSIVSLDTKLPQIAFSGQEIEYEVKFINSSSLPLPNVKIEIQYPNGFTPNSAEPAADINNNIWKYEELVSNQSQIIKVKGSISGDEKENKEFKFKLGLEEPNGNFNLQVEKTNLILLVNPDISLKLEAPESVSSGDEIEYKATIENISDITINDVELKLKFPEGVTEKNKYKVETIETLKAGDSKEYTKKITLNNKIEDSITSIKAELIIESAKVENKEFSFNQSTEAISNLKGDFDFTAEARYYDDDLTKIGSGPIPPKIGETTSYVILWTIKAKGGDLKDISITSSVGKNIDGIDESEKNLKYDTQTGQIKYSIDTLKKGESKIIQFTVMATPTKEELNKLLILTKETIVNATDSNTKENISIDIDKITSDLPNDPAGSGQGVVIE